ncbi:chromate transporter [Beijerinckia sp. L45]|uniref:chromate transporter n=1 Tax=Beijerinckia sp. L45 TaxID=1641855 RepID=UPI00131B9659|nr:chromate transporter [Beijerinckia sp. L45]
MNANILLHLVVTFGVLSLLSIGGANATLPEIHRQVVGQLHWMDDATFSHLVAIGQTAPGPNVLVVSMIGWQVGGVLGMVVATLAIVVPSSILALVLGRLMTRHESNRWVGLIRRALAPIAIGLMLASGLVMTKAAYTGALTLVVVAGMASMVFFTKVSPFWGIASAALLGIVVNRMHPFI